MNEERLIKVTEDGPYVVTGSVPLGCDVADPEGGDCPTRWVHEESYPAGETYALCRCGQTKNPPFCDGSHVKSGFVGTETAPRDSYAERATLLQGPGLDLLDDKELCVGARFCHRGEGTWQAVLDSDDPEMRQLAVETAHDCTGGRLVPVGKESGEAMEPALEPSIGVVQDASVHLSGPLRVKGGIPVQSSDGHEYEVRNRVALCRCGKSRNKPYCDGSHIPAGYHDGHPALGR